MRKEIPMVDITKFNREDACTYSYDKFWYICYRIPMSKNSAASVMIITPILITETESGKSHKRVPAKPQAWNSPGPPFHPQGKLLCIRRQSQRPSHAESCRSQRCYGKCLRRHRRALHIPDRLSGQGRDPSRTRASRSDLMIRKAGMSITKNEPCTINRTRLVVFSLIIPL